MAKRSGKKRLLDNKTLPSASSFKAPPLSVWMALLLAVVASLVYWPSLKSDFVYDARREILHEGFITSLSNLPAVLSLKVLGMNLMLGTRPGQMLYLMLNAAIWGKEPFGYHLSSNLLHASNVVLLFALLRRLIATEITGLTRNGILKVQLVMAVVVLIFALHPVAVESVAEVSYSSSLLVTFFTLLALLAATYFRPENFRSAMMIGGVGTLCAFASVTCKESGVMTVTLLLAYWFLFRRREAKLPWFLFLGATGIVTAVFLAARFLLAPPAPPDQAPLSYLGGSFPQVFLTQPRLWVFMMGKLFWPTQLSADYTPLDSIGFSLPLSLAILVAVILLQVWLACKSRIGALGVVIYWLGLAPVSNFVPLYCPVADRFYYLPLAGVVMQLLALLLMTLQSSRGFWMAMILFLCALPPLTLLTLAREDVFFSDFSLWTETLQVSPLSSIGHYNLGAYFAEKAQIDEAMDQFQKALKINPDMADARNNLGLALFQKGRVDEAISQYQQALKIAPKMATPHYNLGIALFQKGQVDEAMSQYIKTLEINPGHIEAHVNLGNIYFNKGQLDDASAQYQKALEINPNLTLAHYDLGLVFFGKGEMEKALVEFQAVLQLDPDNQDAKNNLPNVQAIIAHGAHK